MWNPFKRKRRGTEIQPDEIFLDARNLPNFNQDQFEGRIEYPISQRALGILAVAFLVIGGILLGRLYDLQVADGARYADRAENNRLRHTPVFAERGVVFDKNNIELIWNTPGDADVSERVYTEMDGLAHILGFVSYPQKDSSGKYFQSTFIGKDGVEEQYDSVLSGENGIKITEVDVFGNVVSESISVRPQDGKSIALTIDAKLQQALFQSIKKLAAEEGFSGGAGVIMDVETGEVRALTSFPEYDSGVLSKGKDRETIASYVSDGRTPFLNRVVSGLYTPGSTVKPFFGVAALAEEVISPTKEILSTGFISVQNPYFEDLETVFNDWKAHGWVDLRDAIAVSSNVYFYEVGGGYKDQEGLGISRLEKYAHIFGLGEKTGIDLSGEKEGIIPNPEWKEEHFEDGTWRVGDTYNTAIGQYGFQISPIQLVRGIATIASEGTEVRPHVLDRIDGLPVHNDGKTKELDITDTHFSVVKEGMRQGVTEGIAQALNLGFVDVAAKTGTAEIGSKNKRIHSWISGFFPYENPKYAFVVIMEKGPYSNMRGSVFAMRETLLWMKENRPEYLK